MLFADETPSELTVRLELGDGLLAGVEMTDQRGGGAFVLIGYGDLNIAGIRVRIPVGQDVAPCVQRGDDGHAHGDDECHRIPEDPFHITKEDGEDCVHHTS